MDHYIETIAVIDENTVKIKGWLIQDSDIARFNLNINNYKYNVETKLYARDDVYNFFNGNINKNCGFTYAQTVGDGIIRRNNEISLLDYNSGLILYQGNVDVDDRIQYYFDDILLKKAEQELEIRGWAFSTICNKPIQLEIEVNGKVISGFKANRIRNDVCKVFPDKPQAMACGFAKFIPITVENPHEVYVVLGDSLGNTVRYSLDSKIKKPQQLSSKGMIVESIASIYDKIRKEKSAKNLKKYIIDAIEEFKQQCTQINYNQIFKVQPRSKSWLENNNYSLELRKTICSFVAKEKCVMVLFAMTEAGLHNSIDIILKQSHLNWILYVFVVSGRKPSYVSHDSRIHVIPIDEEKRFWNEIIGQYSDQYLLLMDDTVRLNDMALAIFLMQRKREYDLLYSDSFWSEKNYLLFKPDWSPQLLLSYSYLGNFIAVRGKLLREEDIDFESSYSLMYRMIMNITRRTQKIYHIPYILYEESNTGFEIKKEKNKVILQEVLEKEGISAKVVFNDISNDYIEPAYELEFGDIGPEVDIIIPTKNQVQLVKRCIDSLVKTSYKNYKITIIDNESDEETQYYLNSIASERIKIKRIKNKEKGVFSYAYINNVAARESTSEYLLFLNNDTEILSEKWLSNMIGFAQMQQVGVVGAKLLFPDKTLQHAGLVIGTNDGMASPAFKLYPEEEKGYMLFPHVARNCSAVTAACMLVSKQLFLKVGGFDEENFAVAYNDIDLCLRILEEQKQNIVYVANSTVGHYEGASRGYIDKIDELLAFKRKYRGYVDRFYNINLSLENANFLIDVDNSFMLPEFNEYKIKLVAVTHNLKFEGAPLQLIEIMDGIKKSNAVEIEIWSPEEGPLRAMIEELGMQVRIVPFPINESTSLQEYLSYLSKYSDCLKNVEAKILLANTLETFYAIDAAKEVHIPGVWLIHESCDAITYFEERKKDIQKRYLECFAKVRKLLFVAHATQKMFESVDVRNSAYTIHIGLDCQKIDRFKRQYSREMARKYLGISDNKKVILSVGSTCARKRQMDLLKAVNLLKDENIMTYIVGGRDGRYLDHMVDYIAENNLEKYVKIIMESREIEYYYRASDIFVCTSENESYPRVILEAMAYDLPILTTSVYGISEQIFEGINGLTFEVGEFERLAELIVQLITDRELYVRLKGNARKVLDYISDYDEMIQSYKKILLQMRYISV